MLACLLVAVGVLRLGNKEKTGARIDTFVDCQPRLPQRDPICCKRQRCAPIDIARKLVKHDDGREMPLA